MILDKKYISSQHMTTQSLQLYQFDNISHRRIASANVLKRLNREIRRRSRVVGVFSVEMQCYSVVNIPSDGVD